MITVNLSRVLDLRALKYSWTKIAVLMGISRSTLYRRLTEAGISPNDRTHLSTRQLDDLIRSIKRNHPNDGEILMQGHLVRMGIRVTRQLLRNSIHRVDHANTVARGRSVVHRRSYSVPYPNFIWHVDSHHKLIRWRIVIHGAIDGFSRTITYLKCADNNRSLTALSLFQGGVARYGLPKSVRSDHGGENVAIWRYMIASHNQDYSCVITGSSVHNERVERLWCDVYRCVARVFSDLFRDLERGGMLDPLNETDLYCLHYTFLPRINKCINEFKESWNNHALSSEGNMSPYQLYTEGLLYAGPECHGQTHGAMTDVDVNVTTEHISVPRIKFVPCTHLLQQIQTIHPLQPCLDNGITLFYSIIRSVGQHLDMHCGQCRINS